MLKKRLIPVLFLKNGLIVRSQQFIDFREFGNPINQLGRLNDWQVDELIYIDISRSGEHDLKRDDHKIGRLQTTLEILEDISKHCFMPLTFGGRIQSIKHVAEYIEHGADKVIVNTAAYQNPGLITEIASHFGSQCCVVGIDTRKIDGEHRVFIEQGTLAVDMDCESWAKRAEESGAGEIFLNSIDRDGTASGYDMEIIERISKTVSIPVIACGGAGSYDDFEEVLTVADAAAAGNIFNFTENAYRQAKRQLTEANLPIKPV